MSHLADPTTEVCVSDKLLEGTGNVQNEAQKDIPHADDGSIANSRVKPRLLTVSYSCAIIVQTWFVFGLTIGYTSPVLSDLEGNGNSSAPLDKVTYQDLFSVLFPVGSLVGTLIAGWMADQFGRKRLLMVFSITCTIGWLLIILTLLTEGSLFRLLIFTGRLIGGIGVGLALVGTPLYLAEISPSETRGFFGTLPQLVSAIGVFVAQVVGTYITYYWLAMITLGVITLFTLLSITLKETPRWLMTQKREYEAYVILLWLRGAKYDVDKELKEVAQQLEWKSKTRINFSETVKELKKKSVFYPVVIAVILVFFQQFSGVAAILYNAEDIFKDANVKSPGLLSSIAVGGVQIVATFIGTLLADIVGRRILLLISITVTCVSLVVMGTYEYLNEEPYCHPPDDSKCKSHLYPMAIASIGCVVAGFSIGMGGLPWIIMSEIVPLKIRGFAVGIVTGFSNIFVIITTGLFRNYEDAVHSWGAFWSFALVCFVGIIYVAVFIPETKGKSLEEIEKSFQ